MTGRGGREKPVNDSQREGGRENTICPPPLNGSGERKRDLTGGPEDSDKARPFAISDKKKGKRKKRDSKGRAWGGRKDEIHDDSGSKGGESPMKRARALARKKGRKKKKNGAGRKKKKK